MYVAFNTKPLATTEVVTAFQRWKTLRFRFHFAKRLHLRASLAFFPLYLTFSSRFNLSKHKRIQIFTAKQQQQERERNRQDITSKHLLIQDDPFHSSCVDGTHIIIVLLFGSKLVVLLLISLVRRSFGGSSILCVCVCWLCSKCK